MARTIARPEDALPLLEPFSCPRRHARGSFASKADWYSWSPDALSFIREYKTLLERPRRPYLINLRGCEPYETTYDLGFHADMEGTFRQTVDRFARSLLLLNLGDRIMLLRRLLRREISSWTLRHLLLLLRSSLTKLTGIPHSAILSPVFRARQGAGFPLHADLYIPEHLLIVYDEVATDGTGRSLLLPRREMSRALAACPSASAALRGKIEKLLDGSFRRDAYDRLFDLLHNHEHPWHCELAAEFKCRSQKIGFNRGEGYLLHDRRWLHGREAVSSAVGMRRFYRLVFGAS